MKLSKRALSVVLSLLLVVAFAATGVISAFAAQTGAEVAEPPDPSIITVTYGNTSTPVDLDSIVYEPDGVLGYNYQRVQSGTDTNYVVATDDYIPLELVLTTAGFTGWTSGNYVLNFKVWDSDLDAIVSYTAASAQNFNFTYTNVPAAGYFFEGTPSYDDAAAGTSVAAPAVIARNTNSGAIASGDNAGDARDFLANNLTTDQAPRLLFGFPSGDPDVSPTYVGGFRYPSNIVEIIITVAP
jgi:hypothetical protein